MFFPALHNTKKKKLNENYKLLLCTKLVFRVRESLGFAGSEACVHVHATVSFKLYSSLEQVVQILSCVEHKCIK